MPSGAWVLPQRHGALRAEHLERLELGEHLRGRGMLALQAARGAHPTDMPPPRMTCMYAVTPASVSR